MNFSKMVLTEHLVKTVLNKHGKYSYNLLFKMNDYLYTGHFLKYDEYNNPYSLSYRGLFGYNESNDVFSIQYESTVQTIRSAFFEFAFGPKKDAGNLDTYVSCPDFVLHDIITFVEQYDSEFLNPIVKDLKCIYDLNNITTGEKLDFYMLSDENIFPASLIKQA